MSLTGLDVSTWQDSATLASWLPSSAFVIVKASEGVSTRDKRHDAHVAAARAAGKLVGHYHYAWPSRNGAVAEADAFLAAAAPRPGEALILDFEPYNQGGSESSYPEWIIAFAARVTLKTKAPCWLYLNGDWADRVFAKATADEAAKIRTMPLWKAEYYYNTVPSAPARLHGWSTWTCWQRTDRPLDLNVFNGDAATWRKLAIPSPVVPKPPTPILEEDGKFGPKTKTELKRRLRSRYSASGKDGKQLVINGDWGANESWALCRVGQLWAGRLGLPKSGLWTALKPGAPKNNHVKALQRHLKVAETGLWDDSFTRAIQRGINAGTF